MLLYWSELIYFTTLQHSTLPADVDDLKSVNDGCGHQAGDELLVQAATCLGSAPGRLFRIGGDEFALIVDSSIEENVEAVLRLTEPQTVLFRTCGHVHRLGLSYGFATNVSENRLEFLFNAADARLRNLKRRLYATGALVNRRSPSHEQDWPRIESGSPGPGAESPGVISLQSERRARAAGRTGSR
jgi:diguanylate cyclase (GGDEF)-like protein